MWSALCKFILWTHSSCLLGRGLWLQYYSAVPLFKISRPQISTQTQQNAPAQFLLAKVYKLLLCIVNLSANLSLK